MLLLISGSVSAGVYKCKDAQGNLKIQDKPCGADTTLPAPRMLPPPPPSEEEADSGAAAQPEVLYRVDPATGQLVPATVAAPAKPKPKPKGNWDRYADQLEQENQARQKDKQRSAEGNAAAADGFRQKNRDYEARQKEEAAERADQQRLNDAEDERFRREGTRQ